MLLPAEACIPTRNQPEDMAGEIEPLEGKLRQAQAQQVCIKHKRWWG